MKHALLRAFVRLQTFRDDAGQDLVEYALIVALIGLGTTASLNAVATSIATAFSSVDSKLTSYTS